MNADHIAYCLEPLRKGGVKGDIVVPMKLCSAVSVEDIVFELFHYL